MAIIENDEATLIQNGEVMTDLIAGDVMVLTPVNPHSSQIDSNGGGVTINKRTNADVYDLQVNTQRMGAADRFYQKVINSDGIVVINGSVKQDYVRDGVSGVESWTLGTGTITTQPTDTKNNTDGNAGRQYTIRFRNVRRNL